MQRVSVIGCPGAGKTAFSVRLQKLTSLPIVHLDYVYHSADHDYKTNAAGWQEAVTELTEGSNWIIDGDFVNTFEIRFPVSDTIIYLDYPIYTTIFRILKRRFLARINPRQEMPVGWQEKLSLEFIGYVLTYRKNERPRVQAALRKWGSSKRIITFKTPDQAEEYLQNLKLQKK